MRFSRRAPLLLVFAACAGEASVADPPAAREAHEAPVTEPHAAGAAAEASARPVVQSGGNRALQVPPSLRRDRSTLSARMPSLAPEEQAAGIRGAPPEIAVAVEAVNRTESDAVSEPVSESKSEPDAVSESEPERAESGLPSPGSFEITESRIALTWSEEHEQWHAEFEFANPGDEDVYVTEIGVSCGCLAPQITLYDVRYPDQPILRGSAAAPLRIPGGGFGRIDVRVSPDETFEPAEEYYTTFRIGVQPSVVLVAVAPE